MAKPHTKFELPPLWGSLYTVAITAILVWATVLMVNREVRTSTNVRPQDSPAAAR
jgi:hypothetical protein